MLLTIARKDPLPALSRTAYSQRSDEAPSRGRH